MHSKYKNIDLFLDDIEEKNFSPTNTAFVIRNQLDYVKNPLSKNQLIFKYEELDSLSNFLKSYVNTDLSLPKLNITKQSFIKNLDKRLSERCFKIFQEEFDMLGYTLCY
jgi:hypothetical protein